MLPVFSPSTLDDNLDLTTVIKVQCLSEVVPGDEVRDVRRDGGSDPTSSGREPGEQRTGERRDPMPGLPQSASCGRAVEVSREGEGVPVVRDGIQVQAPEGTDVLAFMRWQAGLGHSAWTDDPADHGIIPRVTTIKDNRVHRLKAFNSKISMSESFNPARFSAFSLAGNGPIPIRVGSHPATAELTKTARRGIPNSFALLSVINIIADAPIESGDEVAAVTVPF